MFSAEYKSPISNSTVICDLVTEGDSSFWRYRETGNTVSCSTHETKAQAIDWFFKVYQDMKPTYTLK